MLGFLLVLDTFAQAQPQTDMFFILLIVFLHENVTHILKLCIAKKNVPQTQTDRQTDTTLPLLSCWLGLVLVLVV